MQILVNISDTHIAMSDENLAKLNELLKECDVCNHYDDDKVKEGKRIRLTAKLVVKTVEYQA